MKFFRILLFFILLSFAQVGHGQAIVAVSNKYTPEITEQYHVFKDKDTVRQGLYQAFYKKHTIIASGAYNKGKRSGIWHFFDINGKLTQHYDYDKKQFAYIGPEDSTADVIKYVFLPKPADTTMVTRPERIGGILYGYAPYLKMFKVQDQTSSFLSGSAYGIIELLVSPYGRLAECKLFVKAKVWQDDKIVETVIDTYNLDTELLSEDDKIFMPATVNHQNTSVTIYLICNIKANGLLSLY